MKQITFTYQCPESSADMTRNDNGFYCASCSRTVYDFSKLSDREAIRVIETMKGQVCGSFRSNQVQNPFVSRISAMFRLAFAAVFLFGLSAQSFSQDAVVQNESLQKKVVEDSSVVLKGQVTDLETGEVLPIVRVRVMIDSRVVAVSVTDFDGMYRANIPKERIGQCAEIHFERIAFTSHKVVLMIEDQKIMSYHTALSTNTEMFGMVVIEKEADFEADYLRSDPYNFGRTVIGKEEIDRF